MFIFIIEWIPRVGLIKSFFQPKCKGQPYVRIGASLYFSLLHVHRSLENRNAVSTRWSRDFRIFFAFLTLLIVSFIYTVIYMNGKCRLFVPHLPHSVTHTFFCTSLENIQCSLKVFSFLSVEKILSKSSLIQACATPQPSPHKRKTDCTNICQLMSN